MSNDIAQFYGPSWAPATFVTINGTPMMRRTPAQLQFHPSECRNVFEPYYFQNTFMPDFPYFKRWQCLANQYLQRFQLEHPNVPGYQGQSPY